MYVPDSFDLIDLSWYVVCSGSIWSYRSNLVCGVVRINLILSIYADVWHFQNQFDLADLRQYVACSASTWLLSTVKSTNFQITGSQARREVERTLEETTSDSSSKPLTGLTWPRHRLSYNLQKYPIYNITVLLI